MLSTHSHSTPHSTPHSSPFNTNEEKSHPQLLNLKAQDILSILKHLKSEEAIPTTELLKVSGYTPQSLVEALIVLFDKDQLRDRDKA